MDTSSIRDRFAPLLTPGLEGWRLAGDGRFFWAEPGILECQGGHGLFWYADRVLSDFALSVEWRSQTEEDNSGVFLRSPPLWAGDAEAAIREGYEVQIDDRGVAPDGSLDHPLHLTGAIYGLAPALRHASRPVGQWNRFNILALGDRLEVTLNGLTVSRLDGGNRRRQGHVALQAHHAGSRVQFRDLRVAGF